MRKLQDVTSDRALLLYTLHKIENLEGVPGLMNDVKLQQLLFLAELQMFGDHLRGLNWEFVRFPYGAFSKDVDNDLLLLRRKERVENFYVSDSGREVVELVEPIMKVNETNRKIFEILDKVIDTHGVQDTTAITRAVEAVELCPADSPEQKLAIRDISFHTIMLVPSRIEVSEVLSVTPQQVKRLNAAMGY
jgi:hypothetical protein